MTLDSADLDSDGNLIIAKDYTGQAYLPDFNYNGIGNFVPGQAYQLKINEADTITYLANNQSYRLASSQVIQNSPLHLSKAMITDNNMTVVIEDASWDVLPVEGSEIAAYDASGILVGSSIYTSPATVLSLWGDDATTTEKDGLHPGELFNLKLWNTKELQNYTVSKWIEGSSSYEVDAVYIASSITATTNDEMHLMASEKELLKVINVLGQEVSKDDHILQGTVLFKVFNDGSVEKFIK